MFDLASVWNRTEADERHLISPRAYNLVIGAVLVWGFVVNWAMVKAIDPKVVAGIPTWAFLIGYFLCAFAGTWLFSSSKNPAVSFVGYNLVVAPIGLVLVLALNGVPTVLVQRAMVATGGVTATMMMLGALFPAFFLSLGRTLFFALLAALLVQFGMHLFGFGTPGVLDGIFVLIFSGYIGYDWARANQIPKTLDNAVDSAAALYLDIINLFLRILRMLSRD
jgi:FtsH-binding integral membrane protein